MVKIGGTALVAAAFCLAWDGAVAQATRATPPSGKDKLRMVVILSRHGVRSPTWTQERLDAYSAMPWPKWGVPPADLTARGYTLIKQFGSFDRAKLASKGLFPATGCEDASKTYVWADTDQRTVASGSALAEGFFPGCPPAVHSLAEGTSDPLFHPTAHGVNAAQADAAFAEFAARARQQSYPGALLDELNHVLLGCAPQVACSSPEHVPETSLPSTGNVPIRGKNDRIVDLQGPLPTASSFSEDLLLEYADGMAMNQVGWGHVDEPELRRLLELHSAYFDLMHRTPALARLEASNMLFHIVRTLEQGIDAKPVEGAIGPTGSNLVLIAGHDTNLAGVSALLGVHWTLDGRTDDTPPGTELAFELWQGPGGAYSVRITVAMQTLRQLREMPSLTMANPPAQETLNLPGCHEACAWSEFRRMTDTDIDLSSVTLSAATRP